MSGVTACADCSAPSAKLRGRTRLRCAACTDAYVAAMVAAHNKLKGEMSAGRYPRAKLFACTDCSKPAADWDHRDYSRPLDVQPVCRSCNLKRGPAEYRAAA